MSQHTIKMSVELDVLKSSIDDIQKVLNTLKPDTKAFTALQNVVKSMTKDLSQAETNIAKGFSSNADFKATEKIIERISAALAKTGEITKGIQFSDLKLDKATADQYSKLVDDLKKAQQEYSNFQKNMVKNTLAQGNNKQILQGINPDLVNKSFDEIVEGIANGVKAAENELQQLQEAYSKLQEQMTKTQKVQSKVESGSGDTLSGLLDPAAFKKFFSTKQNGDVIFKSVKGGGIQQQFLQYLQQQFDIPDNKIEELRNKTAKQIQDKLGSTNFWEGITQGQQVQKIDLSNMMGDIQANVADFTQLGQAFGLTGAQATQFGSNIINLINTIRNLQSSVLGANGEIRNIPASMSAAQSQLQGFKSQLEQAQGSMLKFQQIQNTFNSIKTAVINFMGFTQILSLVKRGVRDAAKNIKELDTVMNGIAIVTKMSTSDLWNQVDAYTKMAQQYGVTIKGAYEVSKIYYQQGLQQKDVMALTEETLKLSKISGLDYATTTDYMTTALRGFKMQMTDASRVVDVYSALAANTAVSQQQLAEAMTRTASSMESVGSTFEESSAMISTMVAVTRQSASNIGSALKSIASRYGEMKKAPEDLMDSEGEALSFNKVDAALQSVGINMKTAEGQFRSFTDVIVELSQKWNTLESTQQRYIATQFAGNRQQSRFLALVSNGELLKKNLQVAEESQGTGTAQALEALDSLQSKINQVQNAYQQFYLGIGVEDVWKGFLDGAKNVLNTLNSFPKLFDKIPVVAISAIMNIIRLGKTALLTGLQGLAQVLTPAIRSAIEQAKGEVQASSLGLGQTIKNGIVQGFGEKRGAAAAIGSITSSIALMMDKSTYEKEILSGGLSGLGGLIQGVAGIGQLFIPGQRVMGVMNTFSGLMSLLGGISTIWETTEKRVARLSNQAKKLSEQAAQLKGQQKSLQNLKNEYDSLKEKQYDSKQSAQEFQDIQNKIADQFPELVSSIDAVGNATINAAAMQQKLAAARQASAQAALAAAEAELKKQEEELKNRKEKAVSDIASRESIFGSNLGAATSRLIPTFTNNYGTLNNYLKGNSWANQLKSGINFQNGLSLDQNFIYQLLYQIMSSGDNADVLFGRDSGKVSDMLNLVQEAENPSQNFDFVVKTLLGKSGLNIGKLSTNTEIGQQLSELLNAYLSMQQQLGELPNDIIPQIESFTSSVETFNKSKHTDNDFIQLNEAYNKFNKAYNQYLQNGGKANDKIEAQLNAYETILRSVGLAESDLDSKQRQVLLQRLNNKKILLDNKGNKDNILNNNVMSTLISANMLRGDYQNDLDGYWQQQSQQIDELQAQWNKLSDQAKQKVTSRLSNSKYYSDVSQIIAGFQKEIDPSSVLYDLIKNQFEFSSQEYQQDIKNYAQQAKQKTKRTSVKQAIDSLILQETPTKQILEDYYASMGIAPQKSLIDKQLKQIAQGNINELPSDLQKLITENRVSLDSEIEKSIAQDAVEMLQQISDYSTNATIKNKAVPQLSSLLSVIGNLPIELAQIIDVNGLLTVENIENSIKELTAAKATATPEQQPGIQKAIDSLTNLKKLLANNIALSIQSMGDSLFKEFEDEQKNINKLSSGASASEMKAALDKLNSWGGKGKGAKFTNADVIVDASGKLVLTQQAYEQAVQSFYQHTAEQITKLQDQLTKGQELLKQGGDKNTILDNAALFKSILSAEEYSKFFKQNKNEKGEITDIEFIGENTEEVWKALSDALTNLQGGIGEYQDLLDKAKTAITRQAKWKKGDYSDLDQDIQQLARKNDKELDETSYSAVKQYRSALAQLLEDVTTKDLDKLNAKDYTGISEEIFNEIINKAKTDRTDAIKSYADQLNTDVSDINKLLEQAREATTHANAKASIVSSLQMFGENSAYILQDMATQFADIINLIDPTQIYDKEQKIQIGGKDYFKVKDQYLQQLKTFANFGEQQAVSLSENVNEFAKLYSQALSNTGIDETSKQKFIQLAKGFSINLENMFESAASDANNFQLSTEGNQIILDAVVNGSSKLSQAITQVNQTNINDYYDKVISALSNVSKIQTSGLTSRKEAQEIIDTIKAKMPEAQLSIETAFQYNTALHGFVMTADTVQKYIGVLTKALTEANADVDQAQILDQVRVLALSIGDYESFLKTYRDHEFKNLSNEDWQKKTAGIIDKLKRGDTSALKSLGAETYVDELQAFTDKRTAAWANIAKAFADHDKLQFDDITNNMAAFVGTDLEKADAQTILDTIGTRKKATDYVKQLDDKQLDKDKILQSFGESFQQKQQIRQSILLRAVQKNQEFTLDDIIKFGEAYNKTVIDENKDLTAWASKLFIKSDKTSGKYKASAELISRAENTPSIKQQVAEIQRKNQHESNEIIENLVKEIIEAYNSQTVKNIEQVTDEQLEQINELPEEIRKYIAVDENTRIATITGTEINPADITSALTALKNNTKITQQQFDDFSKSIDKANRQRYEALKSLLDNNGVISENLDQTLKSAHFDISNIQIGAPGHRMSFSAIESLMNQVTDTNYKELLQQKEKEVQDNYKNSILNLLSFSHQSTDEIKQLFDNYNESNETSFKPEDYFKDLGNGESILQADQINNLLKDFGIKESDKTRTAIQSMADTIKSNLQKATSSGILDKNEVEVLNKTLGLNLQAGWQNAQQRQQLLAAYQQFILNNLENLSSSAYDLALNYLKTNQFNNFFDTLESLTGDTIDASSREAIQTAISSGDFEALSQFQEKLGFFYKDIINLMQNAAASGLSLIISNLPEIGQQKSFTTEGINTERIQQIAEQSNGLIQRLVDNENGTVQWLITGSLELFNLLKQFIDDFQIPDATKRAFKNNLKQKMPMTAENAIKTLLSSSSQRFTRQTLEDVADALGYEDREAFISTYFKQVGEDFEYINSQATQQFLNDNRETLTQKDINHYQKQISQQKRNESAKVALRNIILNYDNLTDQLIETYANAIGQSFENVQLRFGYDALTGQYHPPESLTDFINSSGVALDSGINNYIDKWAQSRAQSLKDVFSKIATSVQEGAQEIAVTDQNKDLLEALWNEMPDLFTAFSTNGEIYKYIISAAGQNISHVVDILQNIRDNKEYRSKFGIGQQINDSDINNLIQHLLSAKQNTSPGSLLNDVLSNYSDIAYSKLDELSKAIGLEISDIATQDTITGKYKLNLDNLDIIYNAVYNLLDEGLISQQTVNQFEAQIKNIKWQESPEMALANIIQNMDNITDEMINDLSEKTHISVKTIRSFLRQKGNNYELPKESLSDFTSLIQQYGYSITDWLLELIKNQADDILGILNSLAPQITSGTNSQAQMREVLESINARRGENQKLSLSDIYQYDYLTHSFVLNQVAIAEQIKYFNEQLLNTEGKTPADLALLEQGRDSLMHTLAQQIDIKSLFQATGELEKTQAQQALRRAIESYNTSAQGSGYQEISEELINQAIDGSFDAITQIYSILGRSMSFDEQASFLNQKAEKLLKATDVFTASVGDSIDQQAAMLLQKAGGAAARQGNTDVWKVTKALAPSQLAQAYLQAYYQGIADGLTDSQLDDLLKKSWDASTTQQKGISDALKNAASMTMSEFGDFLLSQGYDLTDTIMQQMKSENIFSMVDSTHLRLNLQQFAEKFHINKTTQQYIDAYSALQDIVIKQQTQQRDNLLNQIKSIQQAKPGDLINISNLVKYFDNNFEEGFAGAFPQLAKYLSEGILQITDDMKLSEIILEIADTCASAGGIISQQLKEIQQAIQQVLNGFIDALSNGIKGNLSRSDKNNLITQAEQILGKELTNDSFIRTADGFKLTTDAAIQMYSALRDIDSISASKLLGDLSERMFGSTAGMQTMSGQMQRIKDLQNQIAQAAKNAAAAGAAGEKTKQAAIEGTIGKLQQELALYQQIAQQRAFTDPQSYDFMGQSLPDYLKGPENYWNAWGDAFTAMHNAAENGGYSIQDFYNIVNEMNNIAALTGQEFQIFGETINGDLTNMSKLIEKGFKTIKNIDGKGAKVTLEGIGLDFESGAAGMSGNILDGIHAMAQSQITMLDGLIAFLETIVAMQKLSSVDTDLSGSIDIGQIFNNVGKGFEPGNFKTQFNNFRNNVLEVAKDNEDLQQILKDTTITFKKTGDESKEARISMEEMFSQNEQFFKDMGIDVNEFQKAWDTFYKLAQSQDFDASHLDLKNITQGMKNNLDQLAKSGLNLQYKLPDGNTLTIQDGEWIVSTKPGEWTVDGKTYTNVKDAMAARNQVESKSLLETFVKEQKRTQNKKLTLKQKGEGYTVEVPGAELTFDIQPNNGKPGFQVTSGDTKKECGSWAEVEQFMIQQFNEVYKKEHNGKVLSDNAALIQMGIKTDFKLISEANELSTQQLQQLKAAGLDTKEKIQQKITEMGESEFQAEYHFTLNGDIEQNFNQNLQQRMGQADVSLTANLTANGESVEVSGAVNVTLLATEVQVPNPVPVALVATSVDTSGAMGTVSSSNPQSANVGVGDTNPFISFMETIGNKIGQVYEQVTRGLSDTIEKTSTKTQESVENVSQEVTVSLGKTQQAMMQTKEAVVKEAKKQKPQLEQHTMSDKGSKKSSADNNDVTAQIEANAQAFSTAVTETGTALAEGSSAISESAGEATSAMSELAGAASEGAGAAQSTASSMTAAWNSMPSGTKNVDLQVNVTVSASAAKGSVGSVTWSPHSMTFAKGNVALAGGQKTLMGELGPELVVSNGQYYVVGQSGAQMVDLAPDAIVFNHLQTKKLLSNGHTGRGQPITNQRTAVAWAKGTGPAMASAQAVLAALKQIRAMWQAMLGASMKDLGALAGNEGGGGGGGGGKKKPQQLKAILDDIERWYNLVRQIDRLEQDITYQESLQAKIQSDRVANGKALYKSQKQQLKLLDEQIIRNQQLADLQKSFYERRRQEFADSDYGLFYTYDDQGQLQLRDGINRGMDALFKLNEKGVYGETTGAATNAKTQIEYLKSIGFNTENLMYNGDGTKIDRNDEAYKDNPDKIYEDMMDNFWENLDGWKDELDSIYDQYREQLNTVIENQDRRNQILQAIVDNQLSVQQDVLKAIQSREQKLIDELQDQRDALEDSTQRFIDGLSDQLKEERQMYENEETQRELVKLRRQVAILQRSGGSASQIRSLQDQIAAKQQDQYFDQQQQQIAAIQKASDLQIERLDSQIDLMTKALEYQKQNGLLWQEVYQIMMSTPQQIRQFITQNTPDFQSASALDVAQKIRDIDLRINEWVAARDDKNNPLNSDRFYDWESYSASREKMWGDASDQLKAQAEAKFAEVYRETADINLAGAAADEIFRAVLGDRPRNPNDAENNNNNNNNTSGNNIKDRFGRIRPDIGKSGSYNSYGYSYQPDLSGIANQQWQKYYSSQASTNANKTQWTFTSVQQQNKLTGQMNQLQTQLRDEMNGLGMVDPNKLAQYNEIYKQLSPDNQKKYALFKSGGLVDYTGLAQVDGTPSRPEAFLNAQQTQLLRNHLFGSSDSLLAFARELVQQLHGISYNSNTLQQEENNGVNIQHVEVNVNVKQIANDYDVRTIGNTVMDEMLKIARKSGTRSLSRR